jgi:hypothetical protein
VTDVLPHQPPARVAGAPPRLARPVRPARPARPVGPSRRSIVAASAVTALALLAGPLWPWGGGAADGPGVGVSRATGAMDSSPGGATDSSPGGAGGAQPGTAAGSAGGAPNPAAAAATVATGELATAPGTGPVVGEGPLVRYRVQVETGVPVPPAAFAGAVDAVLHDARGWTAADQISVQRTDDPEADLTVLLASPATTDRLCRPLRTAGRLSCFSGSVAVLNSDRWLLGAPSWGDDVDGYRVYLVNHEVGHGLGHGHRGCPVRGGPAPVMLQQSKGLQGCAPNAWPTVG